MSGGLITNRPLQNEATGIDLQVPLFQEVRGAMMTGHVEYQIVVITRLPAFKSSQHKPGDVVQLLVSKKYSELDEFHSTLIARYPSIHLPAMPRKALFVGEADIRERRAAFDDLVRFISKHPVLSCCPELMEFLGAKGTAHDAKSSNTPELGGDDDDGLDFFSKPESKVIWPKTARKTGNDATATDKKNDDDDDDDDELFDPLGSVRSKKPKAVKPDPKPVIKPKLSLFDEDEDPDMELFQPTVKNVNVKLFEDPDLGGAVTIGDTLLLHNSFQRSADLARTEPEDDVDELFRVEDDLDKLLTLSKPKTAVPPKPSLRTKPAIPQKPSSVTRGAPPQPGMTQPMNQLDICKYIEQNEAAATEDLDLF